MAINAKQVILRTRTEILMDTDESDYRWTMNAMVDYLNQSVFELLRLRKHLLIDGETGGASRSDIKANVTVEGLETAVIQLPKKYEEALMHGMAMRCFMQDSADQNNAQRASYEQTRFMACAGVAVAAPSA